MSNASTARKNLKKENAPIVIAKSVERITEHIRPLRNMTMPKYYIKSGTLELIYSTHKTALEAACDALWETNEHDALDEYFYIDERGMKDYYKALPDTTVIKTYKVIEAAGWSMEKE